jgi:YfiH family protein
LLLRASNLTSAGFAHAFTTRESGDFATLRDPVRLKAWQERLATDVGFDRARFYQTKQVHGRTVARAEGDPTDLLKVEADAIVSAREGDAIAVRVADCVPILLAATDTGKVAAVHAGWRGVEARILEAALAALRDLSDVSGLADLASLSSSTIVAAVGPSIGPCCFEVGNDVADRLGFVVRREGDKSFVDLRAAVRAQLNAAGVLDVEDVPGCTRCEPTRFHSYRRDGDASGRLVGVIVARKPAPAGA